MDRKKRCYQRSRPERAGHLPEKEEQQDCVEGVDENAGEMMPPRIQTVELAIDHVRDPGEGMPVRRMEMGESPKNAFESQAARDLGVLRHVFEVVVVNEAVIQRLAKHDPGQNGERRTDAKRQQMDSRKRTFSRGEHMGGSGG